MAAPHRPSRSDRSDRTGEHALLAGLCSVTLRAATIGEVVAAAAGAGLDAIEWGGDVHVPPGDAVAATEARRRGEDAGLTVVSYGSYLACAPGFEHHVEPVLDTAEALGTSLVRVWCPFGVEPGSSAAERSEVAAAAVEVAAAARARGIDVYLEFHGGTLTATASSAIELLDEAGAPNLLTAWQPPYWSPQGIEADRDDLAAIGPRLAHVHVYEWDPDGRRHPLATGEDRWPARLAGAVSAGGALPRRTALLEFVADDDPAALAADAATLRRWLADLPRVDDLPSREHA